MRPLDLAAIDREQFFVTPHDLPGVGAVVTVVAHKTKFRWTEAELPYRSLLCTPDGTVLSSGFPKFFNLGEHAPHDQEFLVALRAGAVTYHEKLDGSLVICDHIGGGWHARTRGAPAMRDDFAAAIHPLLAATPRLTAFLADATDPLATRYSWLFEYMGPAHRIVCPAETPTLTLLGYVEKATLRPGWDPAILDAMVARTGVPVAPAHVLPSDRDALVAEIRRWTGREGVVARFHAPDGTPRLLKLKSDWYRTLHALRFGMTPARARTLCYLLGVTALDQVPAAFATLGADFEVCTDVAPALSAYFAAREAVSARFDRWCEQLAPIRAVVGDDRKAFVHHVQTLLPAFTTRAERADWFGLAMAWLDDNTVMTTRVLEALALGERPAMLLNWDRDRRGEIQATLNAASAEIGD